MPEIDNVFSAMRWHSWDHGEGGPRTRQEFVDLLKELDHVDRGSVAFRYPMDKKGESALPAPFVFDLDLFCLTLDRVLETLDGAITGIEDAANSAEPYCCLSACPPSDIAEGFTGS